MIEKVQNPLGFNLAQVERMIVELQQVFDDWHKTPVEFFGLEESGVVVEIKIKGKKHPYNLEQLKKLKVELLDPVMVAAKEFA